MDQVFIIDLTDRWPSAPPLRWLEAARSPALLRKRRQYSELSDTASIPESGASPQAPLHSSLSDTASIPEPGASPQAPSILGAP